MLEKYFKNKMNKVNKYVVLNDLSYYLDIISFSDKINHEHGHFIYYKNSKITYCYWGDRSPVSPTMYSISQINILWERIFNWLSYLISSRTALVLCNNNNCESDFQFELFKILSIEILIKFNVNKQSNEANFINNIEIQRNMFNYQHNIRDTIKSEEDISQVINAFNLIFNGMNIRNQIEETMDFSKLIDTKELFDSMYNNNYEDVEKLTSSLSKAYSDFYYQNKGFTPNDLRKRYELFIQFMLLDVISNKFAIKKYKEIVKKIQKSETMIEFNDSL